MGVGRVVVAAVAGLFAGGCQQSPLDLIPDRGPREEAPVIQVAAGAASVCGLRADGTATCWGGVHGYRFRPPGAFVKVTGGGCLLDRDGHYWPPGASEPDDSLGAFADLSCGDYHACGIGPDGSLSCWVHREAEWVEPLEPPPGAFVEVDVGIFHACGLREDGTAACFGDSIASAGGYAPDGTFGAIAVGGFTCVLDDDRVATCWGGDPNSTTGVFWFDPPPWAIERLSVGVSRACGLLWSGGPIECWGYFRGSLSLGGAFDDVGVGGEQVCTVAEGRVLCSAPGTVGPLGYPCAHNAICQSNMCGTSDAGQFCTAPCGSGDSCPPGFECRGGSGGARICWPEPGS